MKKLIDQMQHYLPSGTYDCPCCRSTSGFQGVRCSNYGVYNYRCVKNTNNHTQQIEECLKLRKYEFSGQFSLRLRIIQIQFSLRLRIIQIQFSLRLRII